jgi:hypothetical protein
MSANTVIPAAHTGLHPWETIFVEYIPATVLPPPQ